MILGFRLGGRRLGRRGWGSCDEGFVYWLLWVGEQELCLDLRSESSFWITVTNERKRLWDTPNRSEV